MLSSPTHYPVLLLWGMLPHTFSSSVEHCRAPTLHAKTPESLLKVDRRMYHTLQHELLSLAMVHDTPQFNPMLFTLMMRSNVIRRRIDDAGPESVTSAGNRADSGVLLSWGAGEGRCPHASPCCLGLSRPCPQLALAAHILIVHGTL